MIISIRTWLENAEGADVNSVNRDGSEEGLILSSDAEMDDLLSETVRLGGIGCISSPNRMEFYHDPVLATEVLEALKPAEGKQFFDGTLGGGGHSELLLANGAHVIGSDQDTDAIEYVTKKLLESYEDRFLPVHGNFAKIDDCLLYTSPSPRDRG